MNHSTEHHTPAQQQELDDLISEAYAATGILPTIDECHRLNQQLREAIRDLEQQVRRLQDGLTERTRAWYRCDNLLVDVETTLQHDMGVGLLSAALHVAELARLCQMLRECVADLG